MCYLLFNRFYLDKECKSLLCVLDLEMAVAYWNLVLTGRFKFLDLWNRFLVVSKNILYIQNSSSAYSVHLIYKVPVKKNNTRITTDSKITSTFNTILTHCQQPLRFIKAVEWTFTDFVIMFLSQCSCHCAAFRSITNAPFLKTRGTSSLTSAI